MITHALRSASGMRARHNGLKELVGRESFEVSVEC
jgi:hypothetical protein